MADSTPETPTPAVRRRGRPPKVKASAGATPAREGEDEVEDDVGERVSAPIAPAKRAKAEDGYAPWVDILRVLTFLLFASCGLSYLISGGESLTWGMKNKPNYLKLDYWKSKLVRSPSSLSRFSTLLSTSICRVTAANIRQQGPRYMTLEELSAYDGTDPSKPIYLAINGTIYDVTQGARIYGPDGSYHFFAGCDASRAYVTGCFGEDRTADMRGVEEMYLPLDDYEVDRHYTADQLRAMRKEERAEAKKKVYDALKHWVDFFAKSKKYHFVGYVKREKDWLKKTKRRKLCEHAEQGRSKRKLPEEKAAEDKS